MSDAILKQLVDRLESVTKRLESLEGQSGGGSSGGAAAGGAGDDSASVVAFDELVAAHIPTLLEVSPKIHADVGEAANMFNAAVVALRSLLSVAASCAAPKDADLPAVLKPLSEAIAALVSFRDAKGKPSPVFDHLSTLSEGVNCFAWVSIKPAPGPFTTQTRAGSEFYSNKLLKLSKEKSDDTLKSFVTSVNGFLKGMEAFIKDHHRTGLTWAGKGDAKAAIGGAAAAAPAAKPAAAKPAAAKPAAAAGKPAAPSFFAELNKGNVGAKGFGLKKVDKSQMVHKNPELRGKAPVPAAPTKKPVRRGVPNTPKVMALQGNKWVVEGHDGDQVSIGEGVEPKHTLYIYGNFDTTIVVDKKVNQVTIDSSKKVSLVVQEVISGIEVINCSSVKVQVAKTCPTVQLDKCSGGEVYLSKEGKDATQVITAKCDAINVLFPVEGKEDLVEFPIVEQFVSKVKGDKLETEPVDHSD